MMLVLHRCTATWRRQVDRYIALTDFARGIFVSGGLPAQKIVVKPNSAGATHASVRSSGSSEARGLGALFVGRLTPEKGIVSLLNVWRGLEYPIDIVGDGPLLREIQGRGNSFIRILGALPHERVLLAMRRAEFLVVPSEWYEPFGMVVIEAFSQGLPVIVPALGGFLELVVDGQTGLHFQPGDRRDLEAKVRWAIANPVAMRRMGEGARRRYETLYSAEADYQRLISIYHEAIDAYQSQREGRT
jgi:glycosyltransferase involved in cell wall biosynthesis